jgi:hypothetical protein
MRHLESAERHDSTADLLDAYGDHDRAREHRQAAAQDRERAITAERDAEKDEH